jgi:hypothetical protein
MEADGGDDADAVVSTHADGGNTTMEVGIAGLIDAVLNGGVECSLKLRNAFANFACGVSASCTSIPPNPLPLRG